MLNYIKSSYYINYTFKYILQEFRGIYMKLTENVKSLLLLSILVVVVASLFYLKEINAKVSNFYEYENKKINLKQVKLIQPRIAYVMTLSQDKVEDMHRVYSTSLNSEEISKIEKFLELSKQSKFYNIKIYAYMMFDNQKIDLFESKRYIKLPSKYVISQNMLDVLKSYGLDDLQYKNLLQNKSKEFKTRDEFVDFVIDRAKLNRSDWLVAKIISLGVGHKERTFMSKIDINQKELLLNGNEEEIIDSLKSAYGKYLGIK